jgi:hypothetical protein
VTNGVTAANLPTQPSPLHTHRPLHLMRQPSINPPSFYDDVAPPPLLTPPPNYDDLTPRIEVRDGYFDISESGSNTDEDLESNAESVPETLGESQTSVEDGEEDSEEEEEELEEEDIVDMVGLEDLSLGIRATSPVRARSSSLDLWA